jgi:catechol 2,3-dioxygenase-like lactoylglutathione lyase family enzyme
MASRIANLGHIGIYCEDLERMKEFYRDFMGMTLTKTNDSMAFFSSDPSRSDHEIALMKGRPAGMEQNIVQQISLRVESLADLRDFHGRIKAKGYKIDQLVTHASAIGCYFRDPENNPTEVFWVTGLPSWVGISAPIDIDRPDDEVLADVHRVWERVKHVPMGEKPDAETLAVIREINAGGAVAAR